MQKANNSKIQFLWEGKEEALKECNTPPQHNYEVPEAVDGNEIHCVDNLDFLKNNLERLRGKIKMIYIDPPYNTGRDFIYSDKRHGRGECKHSKWLSFMYPRLMVARELLREDGVIFISIDDNEVHHLRLLMNEVFGEEEFVGQLVWQHTIQAKNDNTRISLHHNYTLVYSKSNEFTIGKLERTEEHNKHYSNPDNDPNGDWRSGDVRSPSYSKSLIYNIDTPSGKIINSPQYGWRWNKNTMQEKINTGEIIFNADETRIIRKIYLSNQEGRVVESIWFANDVGTTRSGTEEIKSLFTDAIFDTPKPTPLIKRILQISTAPNDLILDFFAGSGTTGQAVMELNQEEIDKQEKDGLLAEKGAVAGGRKFILVQLPEKIDEKKEAFKAGYKKISDITIERVRRAGEKYKSVDVNFKVFNYA